MVNDVKVKIDEEIGSDHHLLTIKIVIEEDMAKENNRKKVFKEKIKNYKPKKR